MNGCKFTAQAGFPRKILAIGMKHDAIQALVYELTLWITSAAIYLFYNLNKDCCSFFRRLILFSITIHFALLLVYTIKWETINEYKEVSRWELG